MIPNTGTRVPAVLGQLETLFTAAGLDLDWGDAPAAANKPTAVMLAPADPDTPGVFITYGRDRSLGNKIVEQIEVAVVIRAYSGDGDLAARVAECGAMLDLVYTAVRQNQVVSQVWDQLEVGPNASWHPVYTERGTNCFVGISLIASCLL